VRREGALDQLDVIVEIDRQAANKRVFDRRGETVPL